LTSNASRPPRSEREASGSAGHRGDGSDYVFDQELDATSASARAGLVEVLERELIGPAEGEDEVLFSSPDQRYLLGRIAPTRLTAQPCNAKRSSSTGLPPE